MALFKSNEQKADEKEQKVQQMMAKYGLQNLTDPEDIKSVRSIMYDLAGSGLSSFGALLSGDDVKVNVRVLVQFQKAIIDQNFMLIRILDRIANK